MNTDTDYFNDNVWIKTPRGMHGEYLGLRVYGDDDGMHIYLYRYTVPGRCDSYAFFYNGYGKISYNSEYRTPLYKSVMQFKKDRRLPQVKKMFKKAMAASGVKRFLEPMLKLLK